ncbi:hypothetical protein ACFWIQ_09730 [Kitasatospora sp. NPDC127059]|uniref:hypothetical protein n=1 Tax=unclassified Kitasatospora TaxID=2633591 RepID=UPI00364D0AE3
MTSDHRMGNPSIAARVVRAHELDLAEDHRATAVDEVTLSLPNGLQTLRRGDNTAPSRSLWPPEPYLLDGAKRAVEDPGAAADPRLTARSRPSWPGRERTAAWVAAVLPVMPVITASTGWRRCHLVLNCTNALRSSTGAGAGLSDPYGMLGSMDEDAFWQLIEDCRQDTADLGPTACGVTAGG